MHLRPFHRLLALAILLVAAMQANAQPFPTKPLRLVVAFVPGGGDDYHGRVLAQKLSEILGQQVVVDNRAGAGGLVGWEHVAKSPADGYTMLLSGGGLAAIKSLRPNAPVDPIRDFVWVSMVAGYPLVLVVHPLVPAKDLRELIALAKAKPGQLNYGSSGVGATPHLAAVHVLERLCRRPPRVCRLEQRPALDAGDPRGRREVVVHVDPAGRALRIGRESAGAVVPGKRPERSRKKPPTIHR